MPLIMIHRQEQIRMLVWTGGTALMKTRISNHLYRGFRTVEYSILRQSHNYLMTRQVMTIRITEMIIMISNN